jgi:SH3 domain protein
MTEETKLFQLELDAFRMSLRLTEDRLLRMETVQGSLADKHDELRREVRTEIQSLRSQISNLELKMEDGNRAINDKFNVTNSKLDRLFWARAVVTTLITLSTSILGSGAVHLAFSIGGQ